MKFRIAVSSVLVLIMSALSAAQSNVPGINPESGTSSTTVPAALANVSYEQRLNEQLPLDLLFRDEHGQTVPLGRYFGQRPVILAFVYSECPMLCTQVLNGLTTALTALDETVGRDFEIIAVSFDPRETPVLASGKKRSYVDRYNRATSASGWHFLTGDHASIALLTSAAGFRYAWDERTQQFAHPSGVVVTTPDGRLARYFFGIEYAPRDLKFALMEASAGRIGNVVDRLLLYCYHYDAATGAYSLGAMNAVRLGGGLTILALAGFVTLSILRDRRTSS